MKKVLLVIAGIIIGFIFSLVISGKTLKAEKSDLEESIYSKTWLWSLLTIQAMVVL